MKKYTPKTRKELEELVEDEDIYLGDIDTSHVTDMSYMFFIDINEDWGKDRWDGIETWDTSLVVSMKEMFANCKNFNADISAWDVSQVENMQEMLFGCKKFNQDISRWNVSSVKYMGGMFQECFVFNRDLCKSAERMKVFAERMKVKSSFLLFALT